MPVDINRLTEGWLELESDPGLFTLLLEDFGVKGVQVEEIYDLQKSLEGPVYGFIFLFRWIEERRSRRKVVEQDESFIKDEDAVNNMFFAQQVVPNSCATHALLSVLLNCPSIHLGNTLTRLKQHTTGMSPENKGWAIGNTPELACAHNSHAMPQAKRRQEKNTSGVSSGRFTGEAFHFVSYVPINGRLFELDGLKPYPVDHGPWKENEEWTEQFKRVITDRLGISTGEQLQDIRFNLMAVVPDRRLAISHKLTMLKTNRQIVLEALQQLIKLTHQNKIEIEKNNCGSNNHNSSGNRSGRGNSNSSSNSSCSSSSSSNSSSSSSNSSNIKNCNSDSNVNNNKNTNKSKKKKTNNNVDNEKTEKISEKSQEENNDEMQFDTFDTNPIPLILVEQSTDSKADSKETLFINPKPSTSVGIEQLVNFCALDYATPLQIQTSPAHSLSSTDASSEIAGWGWNSGQMSPMSSKELKKFVVIKVTGDEKSDNGLSQSLSNININGKRIISENVQAKKKVCLSGEIRIPHARVKTSNGDTVTEEKKAEKVEIEPHTFVPKDLLALLKNLEHEINICETALKDENDKRTKYKIDDCRRTHNYDEFICTFLSMLAQQGKLAELVQQHLQLKKQPTVSVNRVHRSSKKTVSSRTTTSRRRRGRTKCKKRK